MSVCAYICIYVCVCDACMRCMRTFVVCMSVHMSAYVCVDASVCVCLGVCVVFPTIYHVATGSCLIINWYYLSYVV